jgi:hypothetical protein
LKAEIDTLSEENSRLTRENEILLGNDRAAKDIVQENRLKNALTQSMADGCITNIGYIQKEIESNMSNLVPSKKVWVNQKKAIIQETQRGYRLDDTRTFPDGTERDRPMVYQRP